MSPEIGVCLASMSFYPLYAGPAVRFQRYAAGFAKRGVHLQVFTQAITSALLARDGSLADNVEADLPPPAQSVASPLFDVVDGLPVQRIRLPQGWHRQPAYFSHLVRFCQGRRHEIDVVQFLSLDMWALPWLHQLRRLGISSIFTHTLLSDLSPNRWKRALQRFHRRSPFNQVDYVIVSSSNMQHQLEALGVVVPVRVIPNGVDTQRFRPVANEEEKAWLRHKLGLDPNWQVILAIGPIIPRKGVDALVNAFVSLCHEYPNSYLVLVGPRHDLARESLASFRQKLQDAITAAGAQERVIFVGTVSNVQDYLQAADLFVFPSLREGMPNVVPEAMACGLPVVMTPFVGLPEEFGLAGTHYVLSDWKTDVLAQDMRTLLRYPTKRSQLGSAARSWVEENLEVNQSLNEYAELYRQASRASTQLKSYRGK